MSLKLTLQEALEYYVDRAREWSMSPIPDAERLTIVLGRMREDVAEKRLDYQRALAAEVALQDPEDNNRGQLPTLRQKFAKYQKHGEDWGVEYKSATNKAEKARLMDLLQQASRNKETVQSEIIGLEEVLITRRETTRLRRGAFEEARANYELLRSNGPALVALAKTHEEAEQERQRAIAESGGEASTDAEAILSQLRQSVTDARSLDRAAEIIGEQNVSQSLDDILAAEEMQATTDANVAAWIGTSK